MRIKRSIFGSLAVSAMAVALTMAPAQGDSAKSEPAGKPASASEKRAIAAENAGRKASKFADSKGALGSYYDGSKDQHVIVVSRGAKLNAAEASRAIGASARIEERDIAKSDVDTFQAKVAGRAFHGEATKYSYASYFDVTTGKLVLDTDAPASVIESLSSEFAGAIEVRAGGVTEDFSRRADTSPFYGGSSMKSNGWTCTSGFTVQKSTGTRYLVTAGHCYELGWNAYTSDGNLHLGSVVQRAPIASRDMELIGGKSYARSIFVGGTNSSLTKVVEQASDPVVNFVGYCRSGQTTGENCGQKVISVTANFCPTSGCKTNVIAYNTGGASAGGDSGAPFYIPSGSNVQARGIHVGRNTSTGTMYAEKWSVIASTLGVSIVTT
ncbi:MAG: hypothetical protein ACR2KK_15900 [Acidimicrobiales bacterium]